MSINKKEETRRIFVGLFGILLNIASITACLLSKNHKEPFLIVVPVSYVFWLIFILLVKEPKQTYCSSEEEYSKNYSIYANILTVSAVLSILTNLAICFVLFIGGALNT